MSMISFQFAAWQDHTDAVKLLVHWGACVNLKDEVQRSPLHFAAWASIKSSNCQSLETNSANQPRKSPSFKTGRVRSQCKLLGHLVAKSL